MQYYTMSLSLLKIYKHTVNMQTIQIHPQLYASMVEQYANTIYKKIYKGISKSDFTINLACRTASEFDKTSGIVGVDNITAFVTLQIILRLTSFDDACYCGDIEDNKDTLICETGIQFNDEFDIDEYTFNDKTIIKTLNIIAAEKMLKLQDIFDDNIINLTKSFCKVAKE